MRLRPVPTCLGAAVLVALSGCGGSAAREPAASSPDTSVTSAQATPSAEASVTAAPGVAASASAAAEPATGSPFRAAAQRDTAAPRGGRLTVRAVRVGVHDGYDRVVFELGGDAGAVPGWDVGYTGDPRQQGSGDRVRVGGTQVLAVRLTGIGYPFDTGVQEPRTAPALPAGSRAVRDVVLGSTSEGSYLAFIGTSGALPYRVLRLSNPARVVVDVRSR